MRLALAFTLAVSALAVHDPARAQSQGLPIPDKAMTGPGEAKPQSGNPSQFGYPVCVTSDGPDQTATVNWQQQVRARDPQLMQTLSGVWQSEEPNGVGGVSTVQASTDPDGNLLYEKRTCASMPGLGTSCPVSSGWGYWAAHGDGNGQIFFATFISAAGYGAPQGTGFCGGSYIRLIDRNTSQNVQTGAISRRVR